MLLSIAANAADVVAASAKLEYRPAGINREEHRELGLARVASADVGERRRWSCQVPHYSH
jgi:hypothetical protein